eukprot:GHVT01026015.1.p1 GENE.GHVT01026015.1~~GHVT01026015.1.p1  ORF type:complete len:124 (+),score=15.33 GHVT01026015.1:26-373(+)
MSIEVGNENLPVKVTDEVIKRLEACATDILQWQTFKESVKGKLLNGAEMEKYLKPNDALYFHVRVNKGADLLIFEEAVSKERRVQFMMPLSAANLADTTKINWFKVRQWNELRLV